MKYLLLIIIYTLFGSHLTNLGSNNYKIRAEESKFLYKAHAKYIVWFLGQNSSDPEVRLRTKLLTNVIPYGIREPIAFFTSFAALTSNEKCDVKEAVYWASTPYLELHLTKMAVKLGVHDNESNIPWINQPTWWGNSYIESIQNTINYWRSKYIKHQMTELLEGLSIVPSNKEWQYEYTEGIP